MGFGAVVFAVLGVLGGLLTAVLLLWGFLYLIAKGMSDDVD